jgi:hypothetical protein
MSPVQNLRVEDERVRPSRMMISANREACADMAFFQTGSTPQSHARDINIPDEISADRIKPA